MLLINGLDELLNYELNKAIGIVILIIVVIRINLTILVVTLLEREEIGEEELEVRCDGDVHIHAREIPMFAEKQGD